jgi:hypothetical protein
MQSYPRILKSVLVLILSLPGFGIGRAQSACEGFAHLYQAEALYRSGAVPDSAIGHYQKAFDQGITDISAVLDAISCAAGAKDTLSLSRFMALGIRHGLEPEDYRRLWGHLGKGLDLERQLQHLDTLAFRKAHLSTLDTSLLAELALLADRDQACRSGDHTDIQAMWFADSMNAVALKTVVHRLGRLPHYREIGLTGSEDLGILFYHMDGPTLTYFLPYVLEAIQQNAFFDSRVILYQLDRIGMSEQRVYTLSPELTLLDLGPRTTLTGEYVCQGFGEWFHERHPTSNLSYFVPIDPLLSLEEVDRVRALLCLDTLDNYLARHPWLIVVDIDAFRLTFSP